MISPQGRAKERGMGGLNGAHGMNTHINKGNPWCHMVGLCAKVLPDLQTEGQKLNVPSLTTSGGRLKIRGYLTPQKRGLQLVIRHHITPVDKQCR